MTFKKNDLVEIEIEDIGTNGEGIGKADGFTLFVKDGVIGDLLQAQIVKVKKGYGYARLMKVIKPSPFRTAEKCPSARPCGGCQLQALSYPQQLIFKQKKIAGDLSRIGGLKDVEVPPVIGMEEPYYYRNKALIPVGTGKAGEVIWGFYGTRSHRIIPEPDCCLGTAVNCRVMDIVTAFMEKHQISAYQEETGRGLVRHVLIRSGFATGEIMVSVVINGRELPHHGKLVEELREIEGMVSISLNINRKNTNVIMGDEMVRLWGREYIEDYIGEVKYRISALSFYQVNPVQTKKLYQLALDFADLKGAETVWDLYCGIGTISLFLAKQAGKVYGVEIIPQAIDDARVNADINGIQNAEFFAGKAEEVLPRFYQDKQEKADVIVVDPPRKGCDPVLLDTMAEMEPEKIVYVSCDPATLARDLKILTEKGYRVVKVQGADMFPQTTHVETVVLMSREDG